ncbi:MAG: hypothetical protein WD749_05515 [Phycisphaerales bacterium]
MNRFLVALAVALVALAPARAQDLYKAEAGPHAVTEHQATWRDEARLRDVPVKTYTPAPPARAPESAATPANKGTGQAGAPERFPVVVFSHGMGGTRDAYGYFGRHLASHGYIVIHPQHAGSDAAAVGRQARDRVLPGRQPQEPAEGTGRGAMGLVLDNVNDPDNLRNRPLDVSFVIDHATRDPALSARLDPDRIAVGGHSFGSYTALAVGGMKVHVPAGGQRAASNEPSSFHDPRVKALIAMSPQGADVMGIRPGAWDSLRVPTLFLTGTKDYGQGQRPAAWRREAFDKAPAIDAGLIVLTDATHMTFSGRAGLLGGSRHSRHIRWVLASSTAFLDSHLKGDKDAAAWLGTMDETIGEDGTVEVKAPARAAQPGPPGAP